MSLWVGGGGGSGVHGGHWCGGCCWCTVARMPMVQWEWLRGRVREREGAVCALVAVTLVRGQLAYACNAPREAWRRATAQRWGHPTCMRACFPPLHEQAGVLQSDGCRLQQLKFHTARAGHPFRKFG